MKYHYQEGIVMPFVSKYYKQLIIIVAALFMAMMAMMTALSSAATPNWTLNDTAAIDFNCGGNSYVHSVDTVSQDGSGNVTGTGHYNADPSYTWNLTGVVSGDDVNLTVTYTGTSAGSVYNLDGTVSAGGSASGTVDSNCQSFTMPAGSFTANVSSPTVQPCNTTASVITTDLSTWNFSETRATGHYALVDDGLHIWTQGTTSTDKVAGYYPTNFPLSGVGDQTIANALDYQATTGIEPGLQLVVDFDGNGTPEGILVGESIYGNDWWLTNSTVLPAPGTAPQTGGGFGSNRHGTINEWLSLYPNAQVKAIGFSLGSGVLGDGVIKSITLGCVDYTFDLPPTYTVTINKYVDGLQATAASANNAAFPMVATWNAANIGSGTGNYDLDADGFNGNPTPYQAITSPMTAGANYTTNEITGGSVVGTTCVAGGAPFALVGYTTGDTLAAAQAGTPSAAVPNFTNLQSSKYVIVWNKKCAFVTNKDQCKDGGWMLGLADGRKFKNQGDCVSFFATKEKNPPAGNTNTNAKQR